GYVDERRDPMKATRAAARYLRDVPLAGVVAGQGQVPVTETLIEVAQVTRRCAGRLHRIAALVDVAIDAQPVTLAGAAHELPGPHGAGMGDGVYAEAAFDDRQVSELGRHPLLRKDPSNTWEILAAPLQSPLHRGPQARLVLAHEALHARMLGRELGIRGLPGLRDRSRYRGKLPLGIESRDLRL